MTTASNFSTATESAPSAPDFGWLVCANCARSDWTLGTERLECRYCHASCRLGGNILELQSDPGAHSTPITEQWDAYYGAASFSPPIRDEWWRVWSWEKHLFAPVRGSLAGKLVVDVGCGTADRVARIAPIQRYGYRYIGVDSSLDALRRAEQNIPGGIFIRGDINSLRFRPGTADVVLCLGLLMYFADNREPLRHLLSALRPGGTLLLHEFVRKKSWGRWVRRWFPLQAGVFPNPTVYELSESQLCRELRSQGTITHLHRGGSPWRQLMMKVLDDSPLEPLRPFAAALDSLWCATVGRAWPAVGAVEIQIIFRKA